MFLAAAPLTVLGVIIAAWSLWPESASVKLDERVASVALETSEIEWLQTEAELHERVARQLIAGRNRDRALEHAQRVLAEPDPLDEVREQIDVVAYRMIQRADDLRTQMDPSEEAIRLYRDVERLFPRTYSAEVARERLTALAAGRGET